jgi:DNA (cytosine-5)-methyltransferase 1
MVNVISLFCGCGGSSLGYKRANCNIVLATDFNPRALQTYKLNFPHTKIINEDIRNLTVKRITELTDIQPNELDILDGSPPCTPFSTCGIRDKGWNKTYKHAGERQAQATNDLFYEYIRLVMALKPKTFIAENVRGLIIGKAKGYFLDITKKLRNIGYTLETFDINAKDFEVAQSRPRIIITGIRNDIQINPSVKLSKHPTITFYEATKNLTIPQQEIKTERIAFQKGSRYQFLKRIKPGQAGDDYTFNKQSFNYKRANLNQPLSTITAHIREIIHPTENRWLTLSEIKRCASFPDDFKFLSNNDAITRIGNSVPPNLIKNIALYIIERAQLSQCPNIPTKHASS